MYCICLEVDIYKVGSEAGKASGETRRSTEDRDECKSKRRKEEFSFFRFYFENARIKNVQKRGKEAEKRTLQRKIGDLPIHQ